MRSTLVGLAITFSERGIEPPAAWSPYLYRVRASHAALPAGSDPTSCDELIAPALPINPSIEQPLETP